jgi:uncharacterized OB-fold protein
VKRSINSTKRHFDRRPPFHGGLGSMKKLGERRLYVSLEARCKKCSHVHYLSRAIVCTSPEREFLYIDELERETVCRARGSRWCGSTS